MPCHTRKSSQIPKMAVSSAFSGTLSVQPFLSEFVLRDAQSGVLSFTLSLSLFIPHAHAAFPQCYWQPTFSRLNVKPTFLLIRRSGCSDWNIECYLNHRACISVCGELPLEPGAVCQECFKAAKCDSWDKACMDSTPHCAHFCQCYGILSCEECTALSHCGWCETEPNGEEDHISRCRYGPEPEISRCLPPKSYFTSQCPSHIDNSDALS